MRKRRTEESTYVVQVQEAFDLKGEGDKLVHAWVDVATVTVPARTKRRRVIEKGLEEAGLTPEGAQPLKVRALNADSAHVTPVTLEQGPPKLSIG